MIKNKATVFAGIQGFIESVAKDDISEERKDILAPLIEYIQAKVNANAPINLNFICTHNSRRSHLSQIWAQVMAFYFQLEKVSCYSGGTEETALYPMVAKTLEATGFSVQKIGGENNPVYAIKFGENEAPIIAFSKTFDDNFNPTSNFAAILTCTQADQGCPYIGGAEKRIPVTYEDPKAFDNSPEQSAKYAERSRQIAAEMRYVFSQIKF